MFRTDRVKNSFIIKSLGGGVLTASITNYETTKIEFDFPETLLLKVMLSKSVCFYVLNIYIPPNARNEYYLKFFQMFEDLYDTINTDCTIIGDFNIPDFPWTTYFTDSDNNFDDLSIPKLYKNSNHSAMNHHFNDFLSSINANQLNTIKNKFGKTLDLVIHCKKDFKYHCY